MTQLCLQPYPNLSGLESAVSAPRFSDGPPCVHRGATLGIDAVTQWTLLSHKPGFLDVIGTS